MIPRPQRSTRTDTLFPYTTLFRSRTGDRFLANPPKNPNDAPPRPAVKSKAVALRYDPKREDATRVVASGKGHMADQIVRIALAHGVTVREDADLVEILRSEERRGGKECVSTCSVRGSPSHQ